MTTKQPLMKVSTVNASPSAALLPSRSRRRSIATARRIPKALLVALLLGGLASGCAQNSEPTGSSPAAATPPAATTPSAVVTPTASADLTAVLTRAIEEERDAKATYDNVVAAFGQIPPFSQIARAEAQHIAELEAVAAAHQVALPATASPGRPAPPTRAAACAAGVAAEQADVQLYDELIPQVRAFPDVVRVLDGLRAASQDNHLPAFQRCA